MSSRISTLLSYVPAIRIASAERVVKNLTKIAVPLILLVGAAMMHKAQAITYVECIDNCNKHRDVSELAKLLCYTLCAVFAKSN